MTGTNRNSSRHSPGMIMQSRDFAFLKLLATLGVIDRDIFMIAGGFTSITRANTRLLKLYRAGLLRRFFLGSGGGRKALYALSLKGAQLAGVLYRGPRRRQEEVLVADFYVQHQLAINGIYCAVKHPRVGVPGVRCDRWSAFHQPLLLSLPLIPDGYMELNTPAGALCAFLEVDLGHESLSVWNNKARQYLELAVSGEFRGIFHQERFRVLVVANSERRLKSIRKSISAVTEKLFWFATLDAAQTSFFAPIWLRPGIEETKPLMELE